MRVLGVGFLWLAAGLFFASTGYCEVVQGVVNYLDPVNGMIGVRETSPSGALHQHAFRFSASGLKTGQVVTVDTRRNGGLIPKADSIMVSALSQ